MDLSIIIPSYNTKTLLDACIASIYKTKLSLSFEIIVVDNASTDGTVPMLKKMYPDVLVISNKKNVGYGRANNQGIAKAKGSYILFLNSDTIVLPGSLDSLYGYTKSQHNVFVGPKLLNADKTPQTSCGAFFTPWVVFAALFLKGDVIGLTRWSPNHSTSVDWVSGACIMVKKELLTDDLLFDEDIFMYMEEIDLLYRAKKKGYITMFYPKSTIIHLGCGGSVENRKKAIINIYRGITHFYRKHYSKNSYTIVQLMLKLKARLGMFFGSMTGNSVMKKTYEEAYQLV